MFRNLLASNFSTHATLLDNLSMPSAQIKIINNTPEINNSTTPEQPHKKPSSWWHTPFSAAIGGAGGAILCFPAEAMKKKLQSKQDLSNINPFKHYQSLIDNTKNLASEKTPYKPVLAVHAGKRAVCELYRGVGAFGTSVAIASVTQITFNQLFKALPSYDEKSNAWGAGSAIASGVLGATVGSTPVENIILTQQRKKCGPYNAIKVMLQQSYTRPWLGLPQLAVREAKFGLTMLWFSPYMYNRTYEYTGSKKQAFAASFCAGIVGAFASHPFDTVATFRQDACLERGKHVSGLQAVKAIIKENGIQGFWKGGAFRSLILFPGCALSIPLISDTVKKSLENNRLTNGRKPT